PPGTNPFPQPPGRPLDPIAVEIRQDQPGAFADRRARDRLPHPRGASGDDDDAVAKVEEVVHRITCRGPIGHKTAAGPLATDCSFRGATEWLPARRGSLGAALTVKGSTA